MTQAERPKRASVPTAVINADTSRHPVVQVYNPQSRVTRVASVGNVAYTTVVEQREVISRGGAGSLIRPWLNEAKTRLRRWFLTRGVSKPH